MGPGVSSVAATSGRRSQLGLGIELRSAGAYLAAFVLAVVFALTALRLAVTRSPLPTSLGAAELLLQLVLVASFVVLVVVDYRMAVRLAILELFVAGASGDWTVYPGGISGRIALDAILVIGGIGYLFVARRAGTLRLGRYSIHAVILAVLLPAIWIPLGLINGNTPSNVIGDGDGNVFFAFALVVAAVAQSGDLEWLRRWVIVACAINAVVILGLAVITLSNIVPFPTLQIVLMDRLNMGGSVTLFWPGLLRLYVGSGIFLQVGVALATYAAVTRPRRVWPWLLLALIAFDLLVTWTRGYWLGALLAFVLVLVLGAGSWRRVAKFSLAGVALLAVLLIPALVTVPNLPLGIAYRAISSVLVNDPSNHIKIVQAQVLSRHIAERPILGWGFGTVAPDYPYKKNYSYEIQYLDLAYKTGLVGLLLFVSFPLRLLFDAVRARLGRIALALGVTRVEAAVPIAILASLLVVGTTNPYLLAAFGLAPIILCIAWLDPFSTQRKEGPSCDGPSLPRNFE